MTAGRGGMGAAGGDFKDYFLTLPAAPCLKTIFTVFSPK
jgi:hypothetical protein